MSSFENFVQCRVVTPFTAAATEIGLFAADTPHRLPAEGGGVLVLTDSPYRPSALEVIRYGRRSGLALYDVSRAQEGTAARDWTGVAFCYQALTAGELERLLSEKADTSALDGLREEAETALGGKVDKVAGKGLSTNDYTTAEKNKLANANLTALVGLTGAADRLPYFTGAGALSLATLTAAARTLLAATNVAGQQSALGLFADASGVMTNASGALTNFVSQLLRSADAAAGRNTLGLGTAATAALTSSRTDVTGGRVLKVGDFGIGVSTQNSPTITDFAVENSSGIYRGVSTEVANGAPDFPTTPQGFTVVCTVYNLDRMYWVLFPVAGEWVGWFRQDTGVMSWRKLHDSNSQLSIGTTAASARTALGLGTAATATLTASSLDSTLGRVLKVGDMHLGRVSTPVSMFPTAADWAKPVGWSGLVRKTGSVGFPEGGPEFFLYSIISRRDVSGGYAGIAVDYAFGRTWIGFSQTDTSLPIWLELLNTGNASAIPLTGSLSPATDNAESPRLLWRPFRLSQAAMA